jgi:hypothetical protein
LEELGCTVPEGRIATDIIGDVYSFELEKLIKFIAEISEENLNILFDSKEFLKKLNDTVVRGDNEKIEFLELIGMQVSYELYCIYDKISASGINYLTEYYKDKITRYTEICIKIAELNNKLNI